MNEAINDTMCVRCRACVCNPEHTIRVRHLKIVTPGEDEQAEKSSKRPLSAWTMAQVLACRGNPRSCQSWTSTPQLESTGVWKVWTNTEKQIPLHAVRYLPAKVGKLYRETWQAFHCGAFTLAAVGMRAVVEAVCTDRQCKGADLQQKIKKLNRALSNGDINLLQMHRAMGNAAVHQMETPSSAELAAALDVLEHLLKTLYELPRRAEDLRRLRTERLSTHSIQLLGTR